MTTIVNFTTAPADLSNDFLISLALPQFNGAEDVTAYSCSGCGAEYEVLIAQVDGAWTIAGSDDCPHCHHSPSWGDLQTSDPDTFWEAAARAA